MNKLFSIALIGLLASGAYAQVPGDASSQREPIMNSKPQLRAEARKDARPAGQVKPAGGDELKTAEDGAIGIDKAAVAGEKRAESRDQRRPGHPRSTQGGTPDMVGAK